MLFYVSIARFIFELMFEEMNFIFVSLNSLPIGLSAAWEVNVY